MYSNRPTNANIAITGSGGLATFKATKLMTTNKPKSDGHILHFYWDNTAGYDGQLFMSANDNPELQMRGQKAGVYGSWQTVLSSNNYTDYVPKKMVQVQVAHGVLILQVMLLPQLRLHLLQKLLKTEMVM